ncbi:ABC transporter permease [Streptomyces reniochalinae]|uniref:ABC transporter permease subunit n=1 Tax=Streptomyces reniochalinae TaxID=2250578 RepID=A0A367EME2_9ACTN|nr:ABC transporter permease subunit [Streptomyces reniochalinae]RCG19286.1 ABC transporter permease subunit [Streptomyces reniochalinae]
MSTTTLPQPSGEKEKEKAAPAEPATTGVSGARALLARPAVMAFGLVVVVLIVGALALDGNWPGALNWSSGIKDGLDWLSNWLTDNRATSPLFLYFLLHISNWSEGGVDYVFTFLNNLGWLGVTALATAVSWYVSGAGLKVRSLRIALLTLCTFGVFGVLGVWEYAMSTLALMVVAVAVSAVIGVLLGLIAGLSETGNRVLRPVFDTMQVMPAFAYLLPLVLIFGIGSPAALVSTVIYAAPPMARLTALGLRGADPAALEASRSLGSDPWQRLWTARLPLARKEMLLGLNQTIMMALSMVVMASVIGAGGLGDKVYQALSKDNVGLALIPGSCIVLIAIWLDRVTAAAGDQLDTSPGSARTGGDAGAIALEKLGGWFAWGVFVVFAVVGTLFGPVGERSWPIQWTVSISSPLTKGIESFTHSISDGIPVIGGTDVWASHFTSWVLNPMRDAMQASPWWAVLLLVAVLAWMAGSWRAGLTGVLSLAVLGALGLWDKSMDTLSQVIVSVLCTLVVGVVIGILAARSRWVMRLIRPILDVMQTMPQFVYLVPVVALVGVGRPAAILAAAVYALPAVIRITAQGLRTVDPAAMEASRSLGSTGWQQLRQVQLPLARPSLMLACNQGVVLVLAMVVIGGLVGGGALGYDVVYGLQKSDLGVGLSAGIAIVCLGLMLDRLTQSAGTGKRGGTK